MALTVLRDYASVRRNSTRGDSRQTASGEQCKMPLHVAEEAELENTRKAPWQPMLHEAAQADLKTLILAP